MSEASPNSPPQSQAVESSPSLPPKVQPQQGRLARLIRIAFIGSGGIRAGWRLAVFLVIVIGLIVGLSFTARRLGHTAASRSSLEPRSMLQDEPVAFLVVLFASWVMSRIEHR